MQTVRSKIKRGKAGASPGTLIHLGGKKIDHVQLRCIEYDETSAKESSPQNIKDLLNTWEERKFTWLNVDGLHDTELIARIGERFKIHSLTLEDVLNTSQRPKWEDFGHYIFVVLHMLRLASGTGELITEQLSLIIMPNALISFQEDVGDIFTPVRERLLKGQGRIRTSGSDYLAYALIDAVVDHYFVILDRYNLVIDAMEDQTLTGDQPDILKRLHVLKREIISLRKHIWPLREVISGMTKDPANLISDTTALYLRDVYDHTIQIIDTIESYRDLLSGLLDLYLSNVSNRMNEVMKVLTVMASVFIPLTFIVGVYGMNFKYMPELEWPWGYGAVWGVMLAVAAAMIIYFKKKKWV